MIQRELDHAAQGGGGVKGMKSPPFVLALLRLRETHRFHHTMSKVDRLKAEIGWLKVLSGLCIGLDTPLIAWLVQNHETAGLLVKAAAFGSVLTLTTVLAGVVINLYRCFKLLEAL